VTVDTAAGPTSQVANDAWGALPIFKDVYLTLALGRRPLKTWIFVANISSKFITGMNILRAYDAFVDIGRQTLRLVEQEVPLRSPGTGPRPSSLVVAKECPL
jgi:hypothetical protein